MSNYIDRVAESITDDLMTNGAGQEAVRLVLEPRCGGELGGWCLASVKSRIRAELADLREVVEAAKEYIAKTPCDPDITDKQAAAWSRYQAALAKLEAKDETH